VQLASISTGKSSRWCGKKRERAARHDAATHIAVGYAILGALRKSGDDTQRELIGVASRRHDYDRADSASVLGAALSHRCRDRAFDLNEFPARDIGVAHVAASRVSRNFDDHFRGFSAPERK